ncbi:MAG: SPOR domain-containing protein [Thalassotalea sp.]
MAHQDYVSRQKNKKHNPYKKGKEAQPAKFSLKFKLIALTTLTALAVFSYLLWSIKDNEPSAQAPVIISAEPKQAIKKRNTTDIPEFDEDKDYQFMEGLKHKNVKGGTYEAAELKQYGLYCASFREYQRADRLKAQIAFAGVASQIKTKQGTSGTWHQVFIGPYPNKRAAEADKHKLNRNKVPPCSLQTWK